MAGVFLKEERIAATIGKIAPVFNGLFVEIQVVYPAFSLLKRDRYPIVQQIIAQCGQTAAVNSFAKKTINRKKERGAESEDREGCAYLLVMSYVEGLGGEWVGNDRQLRILKMSYGAAE